MRESKDAGHPMRILLGGGIGAGKSVIGAELAQRGFEVIDADRIGHTVLEPGAGAYAAVCARWPSVVTMHGVDRGALAAVVFEDPAQLAELEAITHPVIVGTITRAAAVAGDLAVEIPIIIDIPGPWTRVFVDADADVRVARAVGRGGDEADVRRRLALQADRREWLAWADETIENSGSLVDLDERVTRLVERVATGRRGLPS